MAESVKGASGSQTKTEATEETGQKAGDLLLAVLQELKASREESAALRKLLEKVLAALARPEETEGIFVEEAVEDQEGSARTSAARRVNRLPGPVAIQFADTTCKGSQEGKEVQKWARPS